MQKRGMLTDRIKKKSLELLGYEMNQVELRLIAHVMFVMTNSQRIDPQHITKEERGILSKWREAKHIEGGASGLKITEEFWKIMCDIVMLGYVDID